MLGAVATWKVDVWRKLRNAKKSAYMRYLSSVDGKNFMVTNLIAEIANSYYELLALDNELDIVIQNIEIQSKALRIVKLQKEATRVTELAVKRFEAQLLSTSSLRYGIEQEIVVAENRINFLLGRYPQPILRNSGEFERVTLDTIQSGIPAQLLQNRPDIRQAELKLAAAKLDVKVAKARFYPVTWYFGGGWFLRLLILYFCLGHQNLFSMRPEWNRSTLGEQDGVEGNLYQCQCHPNTGRI